jgi:hypothetical protein
LLEAWNTGIYAVDRRFGVDRRLAACPRTMSNGTTEAAAFPAPARNQGGWIMRFIAMAVCALALAACGASYKPVNQVTDAAAYTKAESECKADGDKLSNLNASARQELFDDCMASQGFVRAN